MTNVNECKHIEIFLGFVPLDNNLSVVVSRVKNVRQSLGTLRPVVASRTQLVCFDAEAFGLTVVIKIPVVVLVHLRFIKKNRVMEFVSFHSCLSVQNGGTRAIPLLRLLCAALALILALVLLLLGGVLSAALGAITVWQQLNLEVTVLLLFMLEFERLCFKARRLCAICALFESAVGEAFAG